MSAEGNPLRTAHRWLVPLIVIGWCAVSGSLWYAILSYRTPDASHAAPPSESEVQEAIARVCADAANDDAVPALRGEPKYPVAARRAGLEGFVELEFSVEADGRVANIEVSSSDPPGAFDRVALHAVQTWRYCPGSPAASKKVHLDFTLEGAGDVDLCERIPHPGLRDVCWDLGELQQQ